MSLERNQKLRRRKSAVNGQSKRSAGTNREGEGPPEPPLCHQLRQVASLGKNRLTPCGCPSEGFEFVEGQWRLRRTFALPFANPCGSGGSSPSRLQTHAAQGDLRPPDCKPKRLRRTCALPMANPRAQKDLRPPGRNPNMVPAHLSRRRSDSSLLQYGHVPQWLLEDSSQRRRFLIT